MLKKWIGAYKVKEGLYKTEEISKEYLPDSFRMLIKYNTYYMAGSKKPRFVCAFLDDKSVKGFPKETAQAKTDGDKTVGTDFDITTGILKSFICEANTAFEKAVSYREKADAEEIYRNKLIELVENVTGMTFNIGGEI